MTAKEARKLCHERAAAIEEKREEERKRRSEAAKKGRIDGHKRWKKDFWEEIQNRIALAVDDGDTEYEHTMASYSAPSEFYGREKFLKNYEYAKEFKSIMKSLVSGGYAVTLESKVVKHDESAAFMNSGGECGSDVPYWTYDTVLLVRW